ncbi:MAG: hypothetical protein IK063_06885, partial [Clostridia bacterium]|nr:hypothetical protein [Clostridia bacterium]
MKRYLSIILSLCIILSVGSFYVFAQDESTEKTIDKVEASLMTMEVYCDLTSPECIYFFNITPIHCSYNLQ